MCLTCFDNFFVSFSARCGCTFKPKVLIDRPVSLRSTSFELQAREGLYEDKKNDCQLDGRRRHSVGPNRKIPPEIKTTRLKSISFP